jgi:hypothetical protein
MNREYLKIRSIRFVGHLLVLCALVAIPSGCSEKPADNLSVAWKLDEHGNPDFKPKNYQDAITQLKVRFPKIVDQGGLDRSESILQFQQIVRWLPEFAADTDIKRGDWEQIHMLCETILILAETRKSSFFQSEQRKDFEGFIDQLSKLIPQKPALAQQSPK